MFNLNLLLTGIIKNILSPRTWAWAASTGITAWMCYRNGDHSWLQTLIIGWIIISALFIGGKSFQDALNYMVRQRMDVDIDIGDKK